MHVGTKIGIRTHTHIILTFSIIISGHEANVRVLVGIIGIVGPVILPTSIRTNKRIPVCVFGGRTRSGTDKRIVNSKPYINPCGVSYGSIVVGSGYIIQSFVTNGRIPVACGTIMTSTASYKCIVAGRGIVITSIFSNKSTVRTSCVVLTCFIAYKC